MDMIRKYLNHTLQTNPRHCEEEPQKNNSPDTRKTNEVKQPFSANKQVKKASEYNHRTPERQTK